MKSVHHANSRRVTIYRNGTFIAKAQGPQAEEYYSLSKMGVGSYYESVNSQKVGSGLSLTEENLLVPIIIDIPADDREFRKKLTEFFSDINTDVPYTTGVTLEIGLESDNEQKISKDNMPIALMDFIRYRHALHHPRVAGSKEESEGNQMVDFYIFDKDAVQSKFSKKTKEKDVALGVYLKVKEEKALVDQMLTLMGIDVREYITMKDKDNLKMEKLRDLAEEKPQELIAAYKQGDLEIRATIQTMVNVGTLKKLGQRYVDAETSDVIGNEIDEVILFFKDETNSGPVLVLKARMQEAMKKPLPKEVRKTIVK